MKKKAWVWTFISSLLAAIVAVSWLKFENINASADKLSTLEAQNLVQNRYMGQVKQIKLANKDYQIELEKQNNIYLIMLDAISGKILSVTKMEHLSSPPLRFLSEDKLKELVLAGENGTITSFEKMANGDELIYKAVIKVANNQTTKNVNAVTGVILSSVTTPIDEPPKRLTEASAREIAEKQVNGSVDHLWLETNGETAYYLVEIKTEADQQAIVQIHAITGKVMSVTWDDKKNGNASAKLRGKDDSKDDNK